MKVLFNIIAVIGFFIIIWTSFSFGYYKAENSCTRYAYFMDFNFLKIQSHSIELIDDGDYDEAKLFMESQIRSLLFDMNNMEEYIQNRSFLNHIIKSPFYIKRDQEYWMDLEFPSKQEIDDVVKSS